MKILINGGCGFLGGNLAAYYPGLYLYHDQLLKSVLNNSSRSDE